MTKSVSDFMAWLGGADTTVLAQVPQGRGRFVQMAGVLLTTASIAVLSMFFALHDALKAPLFAAALLALFWGIIILNIDRFLVLSMGATRQRRSLALMAVPRLALAVVLAMVISTPLVLRIFASDISAQLYTMRLEQSQQQATLEAHSKEQQQLSHVNAQIAQDKAILNGNIPQVTSPQLQTAQAEVARLQPEAQRDFQAEVTAQEAWQCEVSGQHCVGSSGRAGNGPRAQAKLLEYQQARSAYDSVNAQLKQAQAAEQAARKTVDQAQPAALARYQNEARQSLPGLEQEAGRLRAYIQGEAAYGTSVNQADTGILAQLQALSDASAKSPSLNAARLAVIALFFLIEILPVTVKFLLNLAPLSAYEIVAQLKDDELTDAARARRVENRRIEEGKSQARINVEDDMRKKEENLGKQANAHVAGEMTKILDAALREWSGQVRATLAANGGGSGASPSANGHSPHPAGHINPGFGLPDGGKL